MAGHARNKPHVVRLDGHQTGYVFDRIVENFGEASARKLMRAWARSFQHTNPGSAYTAFQVLRKTLLQIHDQCKVAGSSCATFVRQLKRGSLRNIDGETWRSAFEQVTRGRHQEGRDLRSRRAQARLSADIVALNAVMKVLVGSGEVHDFTPMSGPRRVGDTTERTPTLGELRREEYTPPDPLQPQTVDQLIEEALAASRDRLAELRRCLTVEFLEESAAFSRGRDWLEDPSSPSVSVIETFLSDLGMKVRDRTVLEASAARQFGPKFGSTICLATCLIARKFGGVYITGNLRDSEARLCYTAGGSAEILRHLEASPIATNAASVILMSDAPLNVASVSDLPADPFVGERRKGRRRIATVAARKARQDGSKVFGIIDGEEADICAVGKEDQNTVAIIERYMEMSGPIRQRAARAGLRCSSKLFLFHKLGVNSRDAQHDLSKLAGEVWPAFKLRHADNPIIGNLPITRRMLRGTIMQLEGSKSGNDVAVPRAIANHRRTRTTEDYLDAPWLRAKYVEHIAWFQSLFESAMLEGVQAPEDFGVNAGELLRRREAARSYGFSFWCSARPVDSSRSGKAARRPTCSPLDPCERCPVRQFRPTEEAFASLHIADEALRQAEARMIHSNPARWYEIWMPWQAVVVAYRDRLLSSPYRTRYERTRSAVAARLAAGDVSLPPVF